MRQIRTYVFLTSLFMVMFVSNGYAGFEFSKERTADVPTDARQELQPNLDEPMPIVDMPSVTTMPMDNTMTPNPTSQEVYIKRRIVTPITPAANEPFDSKGLLEAMQRGGDISVRSPSNTNETQLGGNNLVIDPYPLQTQASHNNNSGVIAMDQAMMEETGMLRPVATPGKNFNTRAIEQPIVMANQNATKDDGIVWNNAPSNNTNSTRVDSMQLTPIPGGEEKPIEGMVRQEKRVSKAVVDNQYVPNTPLMDAQQKTSPVIDTAPMKETSSNNGNSFSEAAGFGRDLPLALALSQIVPPEYSYAFGETVDTGAIVSWQGGKPWDKVLEDMLAPAGLMAVIQNNQVTIRNKNS